jgi:pyruvate formate lyase activating enzyme
MVNISPAFSERSNPQGLIFDIRKYTLHDGPGVRTTVFFKGCPLTCLWCCNPESQVWQPELVWIRERCLGCDLCLTVCPQGALQGEADGSKAIDRKRCDRCGQCAELCPGEALNLIGRRVTVDEVLAEVTRDALYFEGSGGGLTLSGGEPLAQPEFAAELLWRYKHAERGENTAVETCGFAEWPAIEMLAAEVDLFLYDIKHMDPAEHLRLTGRDNRLILENARRLAQAGRPMVIRLPLIAGFNDSRENLEATAEFTRSLAGVRRIDILGYHRLGEPKYRRLERDYALDGQPSLPAERIAWARQILEERGFEVRMGG